MKQALHIYQPTHLNTDLVIIASLIFLASSLGAWILFRKKTSRTPYTNLLALLLSFGALIALATTVFSGWSLARTRTVSIYSDKIQIGKINIPFTELSNAVVENINQTTVMNSNVLKNSPTVLLLSQRDGKTYALASENYPVQEIMANIKSAFADWEQRNNGN